VREAGPQPTGWTSSSTTLTDAAASDLHAHDGEARLDRTPHVWYPKQCVPCAPHAPSCVRPLCEAVMRTPDVRSVTSSAVSRGQWGISFAA
jgi:hypothetical protein